MVTLAITLLRLTGELPPYDPARIDRASASPDVDVSMREPVRLDDLDDLDESARQRYPGTGTHN